MNGPLPPQHSSRNDPRSSREAPLIVPDANRSPVRSEAPLTVMCASICAGDQYMVRYGGRATTSPFSTTSTSMSRAAGSSTAR